MIGTIAQADGVERTVWRQNKRSDEVADDRTRPAAASGELSEASLEGDALIIRVTAGEIRTAQDSQLLRDELLGYVERLGKTQIVVDLEAVRFIGSAGLLGFLSLRRRVSDDPRGEVVLCCVSDDLRALLQVCRLIPAEPGQPAAFQPAPSRQAALDLLARS
jgi:anti-anti-sigma factor